MNPKTFNVIGGLFLFLELIGVIISLYCSFSSRKDNLYMSGHTIMAIAAIFIILLATFKKKLIKQDSDQAVK